MRLRSRALAGCLILLLVLALSGRLPAPAGSTWLELTDAGTGRRIAAQLLSEDERVVLNWTNSLFRLPVTEEFAARDGVLTLTGVTFADPTGREPPRVRPEDVDDLYHTGGPFKAEGLSRSFSRIVFRVGEIGRPTLTVGTRLIRLAEEVGFGGAVLLVVRRPRLYEYALGRLRGG